MSLLALTHPGRQLCDRILLGKYSWGNIPAKKNIPGKQLCDKIFLLQTCPSKFSAEEKVIRHFCFNRVVKKQS